LKTTLDLDFLNKCKTYNIIPKFLRFKLYKQCLRSSHFYKSTQIKLLNYEINCKIKSSNQLASEVKSVDVQIANTFSTIDSIIIRQNVKNVLSKFKSIVSATHDKKLKNLNIHNNLVPCDPDSVVFNYSSVSLSPKLKTLLAFGLDFCLPIYKLNYFQYFLKFECLASRVKRLDCNAFEFSIFMNKLHSLAYKYYYNFKSYKVFSSIFTKNDIAIVKSFASNKDIVVCKPDKGRGVVVVNRDKYIESLTSIISDSSKFQIINESIEKYTRKIEDKVNNFLRKIKSVITTPEHTIKQLHASGSAPGILYGLPKIHKTDFATRFQFRPIFAAYNNPCFKLAKYIVSILSPYTTNEYSVQNSTSFVSDLKQFNGNSDKLYMASFDVENLYTNIPLRETIDIIVNMLFIDNDSTFLGLTKKLFTQLLEIATMNSFFIFNKILYKQCDGLGMGLPQSPAYANIFLSHHEIIWLQNCPAEFRPVFYRRYMDDTFLLFTDELHAPLFLEYLNNQHANIAFTMEAEHEHSLSFLDVNVNRIDNNFNTTVFRKLTFSGLGVSFFSFCARRFKINSITTLINRAFNICSNFILFDREIDFLYSYFSNNGFPISLVQSKVKMFLNKKFFYNVDVTHVQNNNTNIYYSMPYFGIQSEKLKIELLALLNKYFKSYNFNIVLVNNFTVGSLFRYKDTLNKGMLSSVVYKYCCPRCGSSYIGSTARNVNTRVAEHAGVSVRTNQPLSQPPHSQIRDHVCNNRPQISLDNFTIIGRSSDEQQLRILESLYIHSYKPKLNNMQSSYPLSIVNR